MKKYAVIICWVIAVTILAVVLKMFVFLPDEFKPQEKYVTNCPTKMFDKSALVFDAITFCGTKWVPDNKLQHAANVAAQWLDNNQDGSVDDEKLLEKLKEKNPVVIMSANGFNTLAMWKIFTQLDSRPGQDLYAAETNPVGGRRDASQEEIHHIIMNAGWIPLYGEVFSDQPDVWSTLYKIWEKAEENGYYNYNDPTCNSSCKVTEFVYLASAAYLWSDADLESDEMRIKSRSQLQEKLPWIIDIFESEQYTFPILMWPNGTYGYQKNIQYFHWE